MTMPRARKVHFPDQVYEYMFGDGGRIIIDLGTRKYISLFLSHQEPDEQCDFVRCTHAVTPKYVREVIELERAGKLVSGVVLSGDLWRIGSVERTGRQTHRGRGDVIERAKRKAQRLAKKRAAV